MTRKLTLLMMALVTLTTCHALAGNNPHITEVDLDINGVSDSDEFGTASDPGGPGGFVAKGGWKKITLSYTGTPALRVRLNWSGTKIGVYTDTNATTSISNPKVWDMENGDTLPGELWVKGLEVSEYGPSTTVCGPEHMCLEAINNGTDYTTPLYDRVGFTVVAVEKIEYRRYDQTAWVTETNIAAGAKNTDVHKAEVRITMTPAFAGLPIAATNSGGAGKNTPGALSPISAQQTDANGQVYCTYTSSDKRSDVTVKVVECAGAKTDVDLGSTLHEEWDIAGAYDFEFEEYFSPENPDPVKFYPTLNEIKGFGAIDGHSMGFYTPEITIIKTEFDFTNWNMTEDEITAYYPDYPELPSGYAITDFIEHSATTEISTGEYKNTQTVHDQWDYDASTDVLTFILVDNYEFAPYDESVYY